MFGKKYFYMDKQRWSATDFGKASVFWGVDASGNHLKSLNDYATDETPFLSLIKSNNFLLTLHFIAYFSGNLLFHASILTGNDFNKIMKEFITGAKAQAGEILWNGQNLTIDDQNALVDRIVRYPGYIMEDFNQPASEIPGELKLTLNPSGQRFFENVIESYGKHYTQKIDVHERMILNTIIQSFQYVILEAVTGTYKLSYR